MIAMDIDFRLKQYRKDLHILAFLRWASLTLLLIVVAWSLGGGEANISLFITFTCSISLLLLQKIYSYMHKRSILIVVSIEFAYQRGVFLEENKFDIEANSKGAAIFFSDEKYKVRFQGDKKIVIENSNKDIVEEYQY